VLSLPARAFLPTLIACCSLVLPAIAAGAEPPNNADPCSKAGRNTCGTNGVGKYVNYKFGPRWFGDYRKAVPNESDPTFCIDLRYWYPGKAYKYEKRSTDGLKNRDGEKVSAQKLRRMNVALWRYGRSNDADQQGAVMMYVHSLMGDGAPGEIAPAAGGSGVLNAYNKIVKYTERLDDPVEVTVATSDQLDVGKATKLTVRVRTTKGYAVAGVSVALSAKGASGLPKNLVTDGDGSVTLAYTPTSGDGLRVTATAADLPANAPTMYVPTSSSGQKGGAAKSGQRLVSVASTDRSFVLSEDVTPAQATVTTEATPRSLAPGGASTDKITISGPPTGWTSPVDVKLYGPFPSRDSIACTGTPIAAQTITAAVGDTVTPATALSGLGWYGYQITVPTTTSVVGVTTPCVPDEETVVVQVQPTVITQISSNLISPGATVTDSVLVSGLLGQTVTVQAALYGPFGALDAPVCDGTPAWSGSFTAAADGSYVTEPATLTTPGYYTYRESIAESASIKGVQTTCGELSETTVVRGDPVVSTKVSEAQTAPGKPLSDNVIVSGLGALKATVDVKLYGPFASKDAITCDGTPAWTGSVTANGDGTYPTEPFTLPGAGYYTYVESLNAATGIAARQGTCGAAAETAIAKFEPVVTTVASSAAVRPGSQLFDHVKLSGTGDQPVTVRVDLFGPFRTRAAISCSGKALSTVTIKAAKDGTYSSPKTTIPRAGFYTFRERVVSSALVRGAKAACGEEAETSLGMPLIQTGRSTPPASARTAATSGPKPADDARKSVGPAPSSIRIDALKIKGPVDAVGINKRGEVDVPTNIKRSGWWKDGAAPTDDHGTTLIGGHIDSAAAGPGIFNKLSSAKRGQRIVVTLTTGKHVTYKITRVRTVAKSKLPDWLFRRTGDRRLALVSCGGPFNFATGHYRDNVVVTAVPA